MSDTTEEIKIPDVVFSGTNGNECEAFIVAIHEFAFSKGWDEDHRWLLRFAKTRLRGKALRWYARLDPSVKKDWDLLVQALFDQYPLVEEPVNGGVATPIWSSTNFSPSLSTTTLPTNREVDPNSTKQSLPVGPAIPIAQPGHERSYGSHLSRQHSHPVRQYDELSAGQQIGLLRVVNEEGSATPQYIWWDYTVEELKAQWPSWTVYPRRTTVNRHEALVVSFLPSSAPHSLGCLNSRGYLGIFGIYYESSLEYYPLNGCANSHATGNPASSGWSLISKAWSILNDGTLQVTLSSFSRNHQGLFDETKFTTTEVHVDISGEKIRFVRPGTLLEQDKPKGNPVHPFVRARIVFEPL